MKNNNGTKLNAEITKIIIDCIEQGNFREVAAKIAGIHPKTFQRWMRLPNKPYTDFQKKVTQAEANVEARAVSKLISTGHMDDVKWLAWWLERKNPKWNSGVYRWELQIVQKQLKELNKVIHEFKQVKEKLDEDASSSSGIEEKLEADFGSHPN